MAGFRVRRATARDMDALVEQRRRMFEAMRPRTEAEHAIGDRAYRRWAGRLMRTGQFVAWVAETRAGRIVGGGCVWLSPTQPRPGHEAGFEPYLLSMYTEPGYRGRGIATRIVREALRWARRNGYDRVRLHASRFGRRLYRSMGFERGWEMRIDLGTTLRGKKPSGRGRPRRGG